VTSSVQPIRQRRLHARAPKGPGVVVPRDPQAMSDWGWVMSRQLARVPTGRLVTEYVAFPQGGDA